MILRILPILLLTLIVSDAYIYWRYLRPIHSRLAKTLFLMPHALLVIAAILLAVFEDHSPRNMSQMIVFVGCYMVFCLPKMLFCLLDAIGAVVGRIFPNVRRAWTATSGTLALAFFGIMLYGLILGPAQLQVKHLDFYSPDLPAAFDGYRIVQFSDLHLTSFKNRPDMVGTTVDSILAQRADMIVFTGDLVSIDHKEMDGYEDVLARLNAPDGVFSVLGNHDYLTYARYLNESEQKESLNTLIRRQRALRWDLLLNEHRTIRRGQDSITVVGVENDGQPPFPERGDLKKALGDVPGYKPATDSAAAFKVLLSHDPTHWRRKVLPDTDIQLTLSGHTHGMQFMLFGHSPSEWVYPEWCHLYTEGTRGLYVSLGVGGALIPFRFGAWPEINVIHLHRK